MAAKSRNRRRKLGERKNGKPQQLQLQRRLLLLAIGVALAYLWLRYQWHDPFATGQSLLPLVQDLPPTQGSPSARETSAAVSPSAPARASMKGEALAREAATIEATRSATATTFVEHPNMSFKEYMKPWPNVTTYALAGKRGFYSGFRNQIMVFTFFVIEAMEMGHGQLLAGKMLHKSLGSPATTVPHRVLFDVQHWNSFYPRLPRIVTCDAEIFDEYNCRMQEWTQKLKPERPYRCDTKQHQFMGRYFRYSKGRFDAVRGVFPHPVDRLIMEGALRPSQRIRELMANAVRKQSPDGQLQYFTLHARVEPDMQVHEVCTKEREFNLQKIFQDLERTFPTPPAPVLFIAINRPLLEEHGTLKDESLLATRRQQQQTNLSAVLPDIVDGVNYVAIDNLRTLNAARQNGLWGGTVRVMEFGGAALQGTEFQQALTLVGGMVDYYLATDSVVFIGTPISSFSYQIMASRFHAKKYENYKYLPGGIEKWTNATMKRPEGFFC